MLKLVPLSPRQGSRCTRFQTIEHHGPEAHAHESLDLQPERFAEASNLAVTPFGNGDL